MLRLSWKYLSTGEIKYVPATPLIVSLEENCQVRLTSSHLTTMIDSSTEGMQIFTMTEDKKVNHSG